MEDKQTRYAVIGENGVVTQTGYVSGEAKFEDQGGSALSVICPDYVNTRDYYYDGNEFLAYPPRPNAGIYWVWSGSEWADSRTQAEKDMDAGIQWETVRKQRSVLLSECDWTQMPDVDLTEAQKEAWRIYRQKLRDITNQSDPYNIVWPKAPA